MSKHLPHPLEDRFQQGDPLALTELIHLHTPRLRAVLARRGCPHQHREEVVQRTWLRACDAYKRFDPTRPFGAWIAQIAVRLWYDDLRRMKTRANAGEVSAADEVMNAAPAVSDITDRIDRFERRDILMALAALPVHQRDAILLTQYEGLTMREAAEAAKTGVSGVKSRVSRGYATLREYLDTPKTRPPFPERRQITLEVSSCQRCDALITLVQSVACPSCEIEIRRVDRETPRLYVDGERVDGLEGALGYDGTLLALGIGLCSSLDEPQER